MRYLEHVVEHFSGLIPPPLRVLKPRTMLSATEGPDGRWYPCTRLSAEEHEAIERVISAVVAARATGRTFDTSSFWTLLGDDLVALPRRPSPP